MSIYGPYESGCYRSDCGGKVCLSGDQHREAREKGATFFCSRGHGQVFTSRQPTYSDLKRQVEQLQRWLNIEEEARVETLDEFATCPFDECRQRRNGYRYSTQERLIDHLDRKHGTHLGALIQTANHVDEEQAA